jgi:DNA-binding NarL/FixJ family response regulator
MQPTRILIADDHPTLCAGLSGLITRDSSEWEICAIAADGQEAVAKTLEHSPDIVIMDYQMPFLNGLEATALVKERLPGIEVLIFTGTQSHHVIAEIFRSSVRGCLLKSEAAEELLPALESLRRHHTFRSRGITELYDKITAVTGEIEAPSARELEVLRPLTEGKSSKEIAVALGISVKTVETHRSNLLRKLKLHSVAELVRYAILHGLVDL